MKFILPTQKAPKIEIQVGNLKISPYKRVKIEKIGMAMYWDSMTIELPKTNWGAINEWLEFHNIIFSDHVSLDWYESSDFNVTELIPEGDCTYLLDYSNISNAVYFPDKYPKDLNYEDLYKIYISQSKENKALVKNYFNSIGTTRIISTERRIRDDSFWRILVLFSIIESILGDIPECLEKVKCNVHGNLFPHNIMFPQEWIKKRLSELISDSKRADEYFSVIWEVRQKIRHKTVHKGIVPESQYFQQEEREVVWDLGKTIKEWKTNETAFSSLKNQMSEITRNLLLNKIFNLNMFPVLRPLHSVRITSK